MLARKNCLLLILGANLCFASPEPLKWQQDPTTPGLQDATLSVPMDYNHPELGNIQLPVERSLATGNKLGTIVFNLGGPWVSNIHSFPTFINRFSSSLKAHYDIVTFNPRGTNPNRIDCNADDMNYVHQLQVAQDFTDQSNADGSLKIYQYMSARHKACHYEPIMNYANTQNTVRDIDTLRTALQLDKINYIGWSYGSRLGQAYLAFYPAHVNLMMLDSNPPPSNDLNELILDAKPNEGMAFGSEDTLKAFISDCQAAGNTCPLSGASEAEIARLLRTPGIPTSYGVEVNAAMVQQVVLTILQTQTYWPQLAQDMSAALQSTPNGDALFQDYVKITGNNPQSGTYKYLDNDKQNAVICSDYRPADAVLTQNNWLNKMTALQNMYPMIGGIKASNFASDCIAWKGPNHPLLPKQTGPVNTQAKVLLVNSLHDPITPIQGARELEQKLTDLKISNQLLIWTGSGHTVYEQNSQGNTCVNTQVDQFFVTGNFPSISTCDDEGNPFVAAY